MSETAESTDGTEQDTESLLRDVRIDLGELARKRCDLAKHERYAGGKIVDGELVLTVVGYQDGDRDE